MKKHLVKFSLLLFIFGLASCVGDDIIDDFIAASIRINNPVSSLELNTTYQFESTYLNNVGEEELVDINWQSSDPTIISITEDGLATGEQLGTATIVAAFETTQGLVEELLEVEVTEGETILTNSRTGTIRTTSSYRLSGEFELSTTDTGVQLTVADDYVASSSLPGLYIYFANNPNSIAGALEIGRVTVFSGAHTYQVSDVALTDYDYVLYWCKPFGVKVGDGEIE